jgi:hypothetical protein
MELQSGEVSRGVKEPQVWAAADELLMEGQRPTIEKIRSRLGRGSPNTVSPMLDRWFSSLGKRLNDARNPSEGQTTLKMPLVVGRLMQDMWHAALGEAANAQRGAAEAERRELELLRDALRAKEAALLTQEASFESNRFQLDAALASSQHATATMREQLNAASARAASGDEQLAKLRVKLEQAAAHESHLRMSHAEALLAKDNAAQDAETRHIAQERRLLADVDRERQAARAALSDLAKEQKRRLKAEEAAQALEAERLGEQRRAEKLTTELAHQSQARTQEQKNLESQLNELRAALQRECAAHAQTRDMLSGAIAKAGPYPVKVAAKRASRGLAPGRSPSE